MGDVFGVFFKSIGDVDVGVDDDVGAGELLCVFVDGGVGGLELGVVTSCQEDDDGCEGFDCEFHFGFVRKRVCFWLRVHGIEMRIKMKDFWGGERCFGRVDWYPGIC